jgi:hypothetical protein
MNQSGKTVSVFLDFDSPILVFVGPSYEFPNPSKFGKFFSQLTGNMNYR